MTSCREMSRDAEVRELLGLSAQAIIRRAGKQLVVLNSLDELHTHFADSIAAQIQRANRTRSSLRLILPVGPVDQYPMLAERINEEGLSLRDVWFFMMDEYCDDSGVAYPLKHPLSFGKTFREMFLDQVKPRLRAPRRRVVFPDHKNVGSLAEQIRKLGGIHVCFGGIGIHGHLAFNEPEPNVERSEPRLVYLNDFTRTINAFRAEVGGNLACFPRKAFTLGMRQILGARRIRLYCRSGAGMDWAKTVIRLALFGQPGPDYPVTLIRNHRDYVIVTDRETLQPPKWQL